MNKKGQALVEYILIIAIVSVALIGVVNLFGGILKDKITQTSCSLVDEVYVKGASSGEGKCVPEGEANK